MKMNAETRASSSVKCQAQTQSQILQISKFETKNTL